MRDTATRRRARLLAGLFAGGFCASSLFAQVAVSASGTGPVAAPTKLASVASPAKTTPPPSAGEWRSRQGLYYKRNWGVEIIGVKPVSSGYMLAFRYRVIDPAKAQVLNEQKVKPYLIDEASGTVLSVPAMENVGELRQGAAPQANRSYFMIFGNPGKLVKSGSVVSIVAGNLRVDNLVVD